MMTNLLDDLDQCQRLVAEQLTGPLCVHAGAGTGKTRAMTYRIAHGVRQGIYNPTQVMPLTFTRRAAEEMNARLQTLGAGRVTARTFHSAALAQLSFFWPHVIGGRMPDIINNKASLVTYAAQVNNLSLDLVRDLSSEIEWARVRLIAVDEYIDTVEETDHALPRGVTADKMAAVLSTYQKAKDERHVMDFEDVLLATLGMLQERPDICAQVRRQYIHFIVDEYQDVSPVQQALLDWWLGPNHNICVVGDAAQTIYSFAGASSTFLTTFTQRYPGAKVIQLNRDYRSTPQIVTLANTIIDRGKKHDSELNSAVHLMPGRDDGPQVHFFSADNDRQEADTIVTHIRTLADAGVAYGDMAILYRTNAQSRVFEQCLRDAGIPFSLFGGSDFFTRTEVNQAISLLQGSVNQRGAVATRQHTPGQLMRQAVERLGWEPTPPDDDNRDSWQALKALVTLADKREAEGMDTPALINELVQRRENQAPPPLDAVSLSSLHAAKGLEWDTVFLAGCSEGLLPISQATTDDAINEERRLAYVGITRAQHRLVISYARYRSNGASQQRTMSRFFADIAPVTQEYRHHATPPGRHRDTGRTMDISPNYDRHRRNLIAWRGKVARGLGRPAQLLITDVSVNDIAAVEPKTLTQLGLVRGIGDVKLSQFGASILKILRGDNPDDVATQTLQQLRDS